MRKRKTPRRTCVGCREVRDKKELVRIVRDPLGSVSLDLTGKRSGRGAYICPSLDCLEKAVKGRQLERALERPVSADIVETLRDQLASQ